MGGPILMFALAVGGTLIGVAFGFISDLLESKEENYENNNNESTTGTYIESKKMPDGVIPALNTIYVFENNFMFYGHEITDFKETVELATNDNDDWKDTIILNVPMIESEDDSNEEVEAKVKFEIPWPYDKDNLSNEELAVLDTIIKNDLEEDMWIKQSNSIKEAQKDYLIRVQAQEREKLREMYRQANYGNQERRELSYTGEDSMHDYFKEIEEQERNNPYKKQFEKLQKEQGNIKQQNNKSNVKLMKASDIGLTELNDNKKELLPIKNNEDVVDEKVKEKTF